MGVVQVRQVVSLEAPKDLRVKVHYLVGRPLLSHSSSRSLKMLVRAYLDLLILVWANSSKLNRQVCLASLPNQLQQVFSVVRPHLEVVKANKRVSITFLAIQNTIKVKK